MAEVEIAQFDRFQSYRDDAAAEGLLAAADIVEDFKTAGLQRDIRETAEDTAEQANQVRFAAEGLQSAGTSADPLLDATLGREQFLTAQGDKIGAQARKNFERYKRAVEQGASNKSAARIAVQKEMRDMISNNPVYADVIRQAAAEAMGEEEFLVLTRDIAEPKSQNLAETEFSKRMREAREFAESKGVRNGWTRQQTEQAVANAQSYVMDTFDMGLQADLLEGSENVAGLQTRFSVQASVKVAQADANSLLDTAVGALQPGRGGMELPIQTVNNLNISIERKMFELSGQLRTYLAGSAQSAEQINQQIEQVLAPYREVQKFLQGKDVGTRLAELKGALDSSAHVTMFEILPTYATASVVFGDNVQYAMEALTRNDAIANEVLVNSPMMADLRNSGIELSPDQKRQLALNQMNNSVTSVLGKDFSIPLTADERGGAGSYLGVMYNAELSDRERDTKYKSIVAALARRGDPLVGSELARTSEPDSAQIDAAKLWKRNFDQAVASAERIGRQWVKGREDQTDYRVELQDSGTGTPVVVIRRFQLGGEPSATGEMKDVWRESTPIVQDAASESYRGLFKQYKIDNRGTTRRPLDNPAIYESVFGETTLDVDGRIQDSLDRANQSSTGRFRE